MTCDQCMGKGYMDVYGAPTCDICRGTGENKMWMTDYIASVKRGLRDKYNCLALMEDGKIKGTEYDPCIECPPDGVYPMEIDGKIDHVKIVNGSINCCNWDNE